MYYIVHIIFVFVTRFAKISLVCTKWQGTLFTTNQLLHQWTNDPCVCYCQWFTGLLSWGCFLGPGWCAQVLRWSSNGSGVSRQISTQLEIATRLARRVGHQIGCCLWYLELKWASGETFWQVNFLTGGKTHHLHGSLLPWPPLLYNHLW